MSATTIRERIHDALIGARPEGLSMAALRDTVTGPWRPKDVEAAVRKLWEINELAKRPDGTYVLLEKAATREHGSRTIDARRGKPSAKLDAAVKRIAREGRRDGYSARVVVRHVDPALLRSWCATCRSDVAPRLDGTCPKCHTQTGSNVEEPPRPRRRRRRKPFREGQAGFGVVCPKCGGAKSKQAHTCRVCSNRRRVGRQLGPRPQRRVPQKITEELLLEARRLYATGLSMRKVAERLYPETTYASVGACSTALYSLFKTRGWKLRPQGAVTAARNYKHGRKPRAQTREQQNAYRQWLAQQRGWKTIQGPGRPTCRGKKVTSPNRGRPCERHAMEGSEYCYQHDPAKAEERAAHLAACRAKVDPAVLEERLAEARRRQHERAEARRAERKAIAA